MPKVIYLLIVVFFFTPIKKSQDDDSNFLFWEDGKLSGNDFQASPNNKSIYAAMSFCGIQCFDFFDAEKSKQFIVTKAYFDKSKSWIKKTYILDSAVLAHEQLHFDIAELQSKILIDTLQKSYFTSFDFPMIGRIADSLLNELDKIEDLYDKETSHCRNTKEQKIWEDKIHSELNSFSYIKSDSIYIPH